MADGLDGGRDGRHGWHDGGGGHGHANDGLAEEEAVQIAMALSLSDLSLSLSHSTTSTLSPSPPPRSPQVTPHDWVSPVSDYTPLPSAPPAHVAGRHSGPATGTTTPPTAHGVGGGVRRGSGVVSVGPGDAGEGSGYTTPRQSSRSGHHSNRGSIGAAEIAELERRLTRLRREADSPTTRHRERTRLRSVVDASAAQLQEEIERGRQEVAALRCQSSGTSTRAGHAAWQPYPQTSMAASTSGEWGFALMICSNSAQRINTRFD